MERKEHNKVRGTMDFSRLLRPTTVVYWFRFALGIFAGALCYLLRVKGLNGMFLTAIIYIISYVIVRGGFRYGDKELKGRYRRAILGLGTYIFLWALTWILMYTLKPY